MIVLAFAGAVYLLRFDLARLRRRVTKQKRKRAGDKALEHVADALAGSLPGLEGKDRIPEADASATAGNVQHIDRELAPAALRQALE
ncbi:hypothetical protein [Mesorhizobium sp. B2-4-12]|uniref:hypothetical protein n=1 Tax=Mesorhizobium sp. B2-4-12 TaxID=2589937 RepID=UPI0015E2D11C|nr:hypothetical protein [Mesorhizobium sp. B2-4-12]